VATRDRRSCRQPALILRCIIIQILGLDNAGKTTALYKLSLGEVVLTQPTVGSNVESIQHENLRFEAWDLGGWPTPRALLFHSPPHPVRLARFARLSAWALKPQPWSVVSGGQTGMRSVWGTYYRSTDAVILMVDSTDRARIALAKVSLCICGEQGHSEWQTGRDGTADMKAYPADPNPDPGRNRKGRSVSVGTRRPCPG